MDQHIYLNHPRYELVGLIGRGSHGVVMAAKDKARNDTYVALKFLTLTPSLLSKSKYAEREIVNQFKLRHPHVIQLEEIFVTDTHLILVMEYANKGDLHRFVKMLPEGLPESDARSLFQQLMVAVDFCHRMGVASRDIKLGNVLLGGNGQRPLVKLSDFGFSKDEHNQSAAKTALGTLDYIAPEVAIRNAWSDSYDAKKADIWSCGVLLYTMITGEYPFRRPDDLSTGPGRMGKMLGRIASGEYTVPERVSAECKELLEGMLVVDVAQRFSMKEIYESRWFKEGIKPEVLTYNDQVIAFYAENPTMNDDTVQKIRNILAQAQKKAAAPCDAGTE